MDKLRKFEMSLERQIAVGNVLSNKAKYRNRVQINTPALDLDLEMDVDMNLKRCDGKVKRDDSDGEVKSFSSNEENKNPNNVKVKGDGRVKEKKKGSLMVRDLSFELDNLEAKTTSESDYLTDLTIDLEEVDEFEPQFQLSLDSPNCNSLVLEKEGNASLERPKFTAVKVIGKGSFGKVFLALENNTQRNDFCFSAEKAPQLCAIKCLNKANMIKRDQKRRISVEREVMETMQKARSNFFPKLLHCFQDKKFLYFAQEFLQGGELYFHLEQKGRMTPEVSQFIAAEIVLALHHLHTYYIIYRDLKPENIMFDHAGHVKLVDFGLSAILKPGVSIIEGDGIYNRAKSFVGTTEYLSPEMILRRGHDFRVDFWALGMVLYEILYGLPPWYSENQEEITNGIMCKPVQFFLHNTQISFAAQNFILKLLQKNPIKRLCDIEEIKKHIYFQNFSDVTWKGLEELEIQSPYRSEVQTRSEFDTKYFDDNFTKMSLTPDLNSFDDFDNDACSSDSCDLSSAACGDELNFRGFEFSKNVLG